MLWGFATLDHDPGSGFWSAAEDRLTQLAPDCEAQHLSNAAWAFAKLRRQPSAYAKALLPEQKQHRASCQQGSRASQSKSSSSGRKLPTDAHVWFYGDIPGSPALAGSEAWATVTAAATRGMAAFPSQNVANLIWAYATLGRQPGASLVAAVQDRVAAIMDDFTPKVRATSCLVSLMLRCTQGTSQHAASMRAAPQNPRTAYEPRQTTCGNMSSGGDHVDPRREGDAVLTCGPRYRA